MNAHSHRGRKSALAAVAAGLLGAASLVAAGSAGASTNAGSRIAAMPTRPTQAAGGGLSAAANAVLHGPRGYLVPDARALQLAKAAAASSAPSTATSGPASGSLAPTTVRSWQGVDDPSAAPSDSTSAIGPSRFIELTNTKYGIYNRTSNTPLSSGSLDAFTGVAFLGDNVFDPQIIWDPGTNRFYYAADDVASGSQHFLAFGFSKTSGPNTAADWCKYNYAYGAEFPDYPKLGDTKDFVLIGVNVFSGSNSYLRSDVAWITKPAAGSGCPDPSTFGAGMKAVAAFTPVPANQTDTNGTGWVVARKLALPATSLPLFKVTRSSTGAAIIASAGAVTVPSYTVPADATQPGTSSKLDTSDTRPTQAVSAIDPARGTVALWTQQAAKGGAGAEVRWYEINPATHTLFQSGSVTSSTLFSFNGAISPDRKVAGTTHLFGSNMVLGYNTSSSGQRADFRLVSKVGSGAQSSPALIVISNGSCTGVSVCRWGDYAAATPDPAAPSTSSVGQVWLTSQLHHGGTQFDWATWNIGAKP